MPENEATPAVQPEESKLQDFTVTVPLQVEVTIHAENLTEAKKLAKAAVADGNVDVLYQTITFCGEQVQILCGVALSGDVRSGRWTKGDPRRTFVPWPIGKIGIEHQPKLPPEKTKKRK